ATLVGASVISSDGLLAAEPTSPNSVVTHLLPFWKPSCSSSWVSSQVAVRTPSPAPGGSRPGSAPLPALPLPALPLPLPALPLPALPLSAGAVAAGGAAGASLSVHFERPSAFR